MHIRTNHAGQVAFHNEAFHPMEEWQEFYDHYRNEYKYCTNMRGRVVLQQFLIDLERVLVNLSAA